MSENVVSKVGVEKMRENARVQIIHAKIWSHRRISERFPFVLLILKEGGKLDHSLFRDLDLMKALIPFFLAYCSFCRLNGNPRHEHSEFNPEGTKETNHWKTKKRRRVEFKGPLPEWFRAGQKFYSRLRPPLFQLARPDSSIREVQLVA